MFRRYRLLKVLTKTYSNAEVTAIALPALSYRQAKNGQIKNPEAYVHFHVIARKSTKFLLPTKGVGRVADTSFANGISILKRTTTASTRPVARQDSSPDIAHFVSGKFYVHDLDFDMTWVCVCVCVCVWRGVRGGGGECSICLDTK